MDVYYPQEMEQGTILPAVILVSGELPPEFIERGKDTGIYISYGQLIAASGQELFLIYTGRGTNDAGILSGSLPM